MSTDINDKIQLRGNLKGKITRFVNFLGTIKDKSDAKVKQIPPRLVDLKIIFRDLERINYELEVLDSVNVDNHLEYREAFENAYFSALAQADDIMGVQNIPMTASEHTNISNISNQYNVKLPQIALPNFDGAYDKWGQFFDIFMSLIDKNPNLSDIQKFYYLQSCLQGEALEIIQNLQLTNDNYDLAWGLLKERYENRKLIIKTHIKNLFDLASVTKDSYLSLRTFLDTFLKNYRSLQNLNEPVHQWNAILIYLLSNKLDIISKKEWEIFAKNEQSPKIDDFIIFLTDRCLLLESLDNKTIEPSNNLKCSPRKNARVYAATNGVNVQKCLFCAKDHYILSCIQFKSLAIPLRWQEIIKLKACTNCLKIGHYFQSCNANPCRICGKRHNTLLHMENFAILGNKFKPTKSTIPANPQINADTNQNSLLPNNIQTNTNLMDTPTCSSFVPNSSPQFDSIPQRTLLTQQTNDIQFLSKINTTYTPDNNERSNLVLHNTSAKTLKVLLGTAQIQIFDKYGSVLKVRALLDARSESSFITTNLVKKLGLARRKLRIPVQGINETQINIESSTNATIKSVYSDFTTSTNLLILDKITGNIPEQNVKRELICIPTDILLADPEFDRASSIDILLGADVFYYLLLPEQIKTNMNSPVLQNTELGWIISGKLIEPKSSSITCHVSNSHIQAALERFWALEEVSLDSSKNNSKSDVEYCEAQFLNTFERASDGRFILRLPFKENVAELSSNKEQALKRFYFLEKKLNVDAELKLKYSKFMDEYIKLGHMSKINDNITDDSTFRHYLPHHGVKKETSLTTKLRVVFDGSAKTQYGLSLNNVLRTGPCIQNDIFTILTNFRIHNIIITADIEKMYRQVFIHEEDRNFQCIVWRSSPDEDVSHYKLNTITYGLAPSSFLATRCLKQLALEFKETFPDTSDIILNNFYMDDFICGANDLQSAISLVKEVDQILNTAGFKLRQWNSNKPQIFSHLPSNSNDDNYIIKDSLKAKTLGMFLNVKHDFFYFVVNIINYEYITKRIMLSIVSQIFDPLGFLGPVMIKSKILLQHLWSSKLSWDEPIQGDLLFEWNEFYNQLNEINDISVPRQLTLSSYIQVEMHCFCDASQLAYGACIYLVTHNVDTILSRLICAKSRVAPLKSQSIPRLELCGALLCAQLCVKVRAALRFDIQAIHCWTDSMIVLSWINSEPHRYETFVSNRISQIQSLTKDCKWNHVPTELNPADYISRGVSALKLKDLVPWWCGPGFLKVSKNSWPITNVIKSVDLPETKRNTMLVLNSVPTFDILHKYSSYNKLINVTAYILRFVNNTRTTLKNNGLLTLTETETALKCLIKLVQSEEFTREIHDLKRTKRVNNNSKLITLSPYLDSDNILRVGGRLTHSSLSYDAKHPIILPGKHNFTTLLVRNEHYKNFHAGCNFLLNKIRQRFWVLRGRQALKGVLRSCIICFRYRPKFNHSIMADLPSSRVNVSRPFSTSGVDFAGPFQMKETKFRNKRFIKVYFCIFVCFSTRAVHIEVVTDLSTFAFLNCLKRFISRRGVCRKIYSDNATNFVGANNYLSKFASMFREDDIHNFLLMHRIVWSFIPAKSPSFGGLWESAVRIAKSHLKSILNNEHLTLEEFFTFTSQIESIMNSRPLSPLTEESENLEVITPGHFLVGDYLYALPEPHIENERETISSRYKRLQFLIQTFWKKWSLEYLQNLQKRNKWYYSNIPEDLFGKLVLLVDNDLPSHIWKIGRIINTHPGKDGMIRVVTLKTSTGEVKRSVTKICLLPISVERYSASNGGSMKNKF